MKRFSFFILVFAFENSVLITRTIRDWHERGGTHSTGMDSSSLNVVSENRRNMELNYFTCDICQIAFVTSLAEKSAKKLKLRCMFCRSHLQAHYHSRKADNHLRYRRFDDAVDSHQKAANALDEALHSTSLPKAIESIKLQRDYHMKHIELIRLKKQQYERYKLAVEHQRQKDADFLAQRNAKDRFETACDLQISIYKTLEESDVLLNALNKSRRLSGSSKDSDSARSVDAAMDESKTVSIENSVEVKMGNARKTMKDDTAVIDELHTLNHQLHILVYTLVSRLDESSQESEGLREKIKTIEKERIVQRVLPLNEASDSSGAGMTAAAKDDLLVKAAYGTPERELSRRCSITGEERKIILPDSSELPPLELPEFDYSSFDEKL